MRSVLNFNTFLSLVKYPGFGEVRVDKENDNASALFVNFDRSISLFVSYWGQIGSMPLLSRCVPVI